MKNSTTLYNNLPKETRLITQTLMLYTEVNNLVILIDEVEKHAKKQTTRLRDKIRRIQVEINNNEKIL